MERLGPALTIQGNNGLTNGQITNASGGCHDEGEVTRWQNIEKYST